MSVKPGVHSSDVQRAAATTGGVICLPLTLRCQPPSLNSIRGACSFRCSGKRSTQQSGSSMWLSAEMITVPSGQALVAACGLRSGESAIPTISGISSTKPSSAIFSSSAIFAALASGDAIARDPWEGERNLHRVTPIVDDMAALH